MSGFDATHHLVSNRLVTLEGDAATCRAYATAWHMLEQDGAQASCLVRGYYEFGLRRTAGGWLVDRLVITLAGAEGDMGLYDVARERVTART